MAEIRTVFLMYHELELPGRALCRTEPGYVRYILPAANFEAQMETLNGSGWRGLSVSSALQYDASDAVAVTFDDGCETDLLAAVPVLQRHGFGATFYVTAGFLGSRGYLSPAQLRELSDAGFEVGCHSMTHAYLTDLDPSGLRHEIAEAKLRLEDIIGKPVEHFSCPGGRWSQAAANTAREAGYHSVANSETHPNSSDIDRFALGRIAMMRQTSVPEFMAICHGETMWRRNASSAFRGGFKKLLGNRLYDRLRDAVLGGEKQ